MKNTKSLNEHLKEISPMGWKAKVKKYGLKKAKEMMKEQSQQYWLNHRVVHKTVKTPSK